MFFGINTYFLKQIFPEQTHIFKNRNSLKKQIRVTVRKKEKSNRLFSLLLSGEMIFLLSFQREV